MHKNEAVPSLVVSFYSQDNNDIFILILREMRLSLASRSHNQQYLFLNHNA